MKKRKEGAITHKIELTIGDLAQMIEAMEDMVKLVGHQNTILRQKIESGPALLTMYLQNMIILNSIAVENTMKIMGIINETLFEALANTKQEGNA